jgi:phosphate transport system permease protein
MALVITVFLGSVVKASIPGWQAGGFSFFSHANWVFGPANEQGVTYGALPLIMGTLLTTLAALVVAVPIAIGAAVALVFLVPRRLQTPIAAVIELLAVVPSVIYGVWGTLVIHKWLSASGQPWIVAHWFHGAWPFNGAPQGAGMLLGAIVLSVMVLPTITAVSRDVIALVPRDLVEGSLSLGATRSQTIFRVVLPTSRSGLMGAIVLGAGRAIGETVAMAFLLGGVTAMSPHPTNLFSTGSTLAAEIANDFLESVGQPGLIGVLCVLALILMVIVVAVNYLAQRIIRRAELKLV